MYIGEFCKLTHTTPKTIRYYESLGLLPKPKRQGSYRVYDDTYVETVRQIKLAQHFGFTLSELKTLFQGTDTRRGLPPQIILNAIADKRLAIEKQRQALARQDTDLQRMEDELKKSPCFIDSAP